MTVDPAPREARFLVEYLITNHDLTTTMSTHEEALINKAEDTILSHGRDIETLPHSEQKLLRNNSGPEWRGAGVIITSDMAYKPTDMFDANAFIVHSTHASRLVWTVSMIQAAFRHYLIASNKDEFFLDLARVAKRRLKDSGDTPEGCTRAQKDMVSNALEKLRIIKRGKIFPETDASVLTGPPSDEA